MFDVMLRQLQSAIQYIQQTPTHLVMLCPTPKIQQECANLLSVLIPSGCKSVGLIVLFPNGSKVSIQLVSEDVPPKGNDFSVLLVEGDKTYDWKDSSLWQKRAQMILT